MLKSDVMESMQRLAVFQFLATNPEKKEKLQKKRKRALKKIKTKITQATTAAKRGLARV